MYIYTLSYKLLKLQIKYYQILLGIYFKIGDSNPHSPPFFPPPPLPCRLICLNVPVLYFRLFHLKCEAILMKEKE